MKYNPRCLWCNSLFGTNRKDQLYCSRLCGKKMKYKQDREREKNNRDFYNSQYRKRRRRSRVNAIIMLGGKCRECGYDDIRALQIDHINGDGHSERVSAPKMVRDIASGKYDKKKYQLLCANCNVIKVKIKCEGTTKEDYNQYLIEANKKIKKNEKTKNK